MAGEQAVYKVLAANSGVTNIVSNRIWGGGQAPLESAYPYVTLQVLGIADRTPAITGPTGLVGKRMQVNCVTTSYTQATQLADRVTVALNTYSGTGGTETVRGIFVEDELDVTVPRIEGSDKHLYVKLLPSVLWVDEATS